MNPKWIVQWCLKCFYSGLHLILECRDTKLLALKFLFASQCFYPEGQSQKKRTGEAVHNNRRNYLSGLIFRRNHAPGRAGRGMSVGEGNGDGATGCGWSGRTILGTEIQGLCWLVEERVHHIQGLEQQPRLQGKGFCSAASNVAVTSWATSQRYCASRQILLAFERYEKISKKVGWALDGIDNVAVVVRARDSHFSSCSNKHSNQMASC